MKKLAFSRRFIFTLFAVLFSVNLWGQAPTPTLSLLDPEAAYNAASNPYVVTSAEDWNTLASDVMAGYDYSGKVVKLTNNIEVSTMIGGDDEYYNQFAFRGTFDGEYDETIHTLTFNRAVDDYGYAPFYYTSGATIKNLKVNGGITATYGFSSGLIYCNIYDEEDEDQDLTCVQNVTVDVNLDDEGQGYCGGFAVYGKGVCFEHCDYTGTLVFVFVEEGLTSNGFTALYSSIFNNCIFNPDDGSVLNGVANFGSGEVNNCYYTMQVGSSTQGVLAYKTAQDNIITKAITVNSTTVYKPVTVVETGVASVYDYTGSTISITPTVTFDGKNVTNNNQYTYTISPATVKDAGEYTLTIYGKNENGYYGSYTKKFYVVEPLSGSGTSEDPYIIASEANWHTFANNVNTYGCSYSGQYLKLTANISVTTMVGTSTHPFSGNFTGRIGNTYGAYTLTFNCGSSFYDATSEEIVAPFRYTDGATITSLIVDGAIHTKVGKEAGLIGINTFTTERATTLEYIINNMDFYCYEELWDAEGGGYAYDGSNIHFSYCSYEGTISASNYHGGFCGKANGNTRFTRCLFDPEGGMYWAENFVYDEQGATINYDGPDPNDDTDGCFYTVGNNQEESTQGTMVYVNDVPNGNIGKKITTFHEKEIYKPVTVVITGVNDAYIYNNGAELLNISDVGVTFNGGDALVNGWCTKEIIKNGETPTVVTSVTAIGDYTLSIVGVDNSSAAVNPFKYKGTIPQVFYVVSGTSGRWTALQARLNNAAKDTIQITHDITAGAADVALSIPASRTVTIYLNGHTIDRGKSGNSAIAVTNGQVLRIAAGATVTIEGGNGGTIRGGYNIAVNNNENANNDGGGISNLGNLTLNNVIVKDNRCKKTGENTSRTARGGGIYSGKNSTLTINGCEITNNSAEGGGGGIFVYQASNFTMNKYNSSIQPNVHGNTSKDKGGGIRVDATNSTTATINDGLINSNTVEYLSTLSVSNGGGIHLDAGDLTLNNCTINNNRASKFGGGIYIMGGRLYANNCSINSNMSYDETSRFDGCGGGICLLGGKCYLNGGTISGNSSSVIDGGGVYVNSGTLFSIEGTVNITGNWKFISNTGGSMQTTNVYLVKADGKITIAGNIGSSTIGVSKKGGEGVFTNGLDGNGDIFNFSSDNSVYSIVSYNNEAKLTTISPVDPPVSGVWEINEPVILQETVPSVGHDVTSIVIGNNGCLYVNTGGYINGVSITNNTTNAETKLIINGGQVIPSNSGVLATVKKDISYALPLSQGNWYLISSPLLTPTGENPVVYNPISILDKTNLIVKNANNYPEYDLYRFNEGATQTNTIGYELQWENYRACDTANEVITPVHDDFAYCDDESYLEKGRGYLYRNYNNYTITMTGAINIESPINYTLSYTPTVNSHDNVFRGFNIIGNPYTHNISKGITGAAIPNTYLEAKYYVLDETDGSWDLTDDGTAIPPVTGILVQATEANTLTITNSTTVGGSKDVANNNIWFTVANSRYDDRACVEFRNGHGLNKIAHINEDAPMLYIHHNDEDFASVDMAPDTRAINLNFEAKKTGTYTLKIDANGDYKYLHLIDKLAEKDIDLLLEGEYTFVGSKNDKADRFIVRLENSESAENSIFAYQSGNDIIVSGEGELQVFDVMGRLVAQKYVNGVETMCTSSMHIGVYILRLNEMTQKIIIK